jgi:tetratricopeptide (TPR) repeat protein
MRVRHLVAALLLFAVAFAIRWDLLCGLILGDDPQEFPMILQIMSHGPDWKDQLHLRFAGWILNYFSFVLFGVSETTLFLPTFIVSSSLPVIAYALLVRWGYRPVRALLGGLFVATAPFEVVLGTLRANDLYLAWALALGFALLVFLEERPVLQGLGIAVCLWFGFYVKLWAVYVLPALGIYYVMGRRWRAALSFCAVSAVVHGITCAYWKAQLGTYMPFFTATAFSYAVPRQEVVRVLLKYPLVMFRGSEEFGTTFFGAVAYVLLLLLVVKGIVQRRFDRADRLLIGFYGSVFLLIEFFPNGFKLDAYYSVPRIFRYLAPLSFPMTLHAAKMLLDMSPSRLRLGRLDVAAAVPVLLVGLNLHHAAEATRVARVYRQNLRAVLRDLERLKPPKFVAEAVMAGYFKDLYVDADRYPIDVVVPIGPHNAPDYERWLGDNEASLPEGTMLLSGLGSFIHYGAHLDGFRLEWFDQPLSARWKLVKEYGLLTYLPRPERTRLWRLRHLPGDEAAAKDGVDDVSIAADVADPNVLFERGMARMNQGDYRAARGYFRKLRLDHPSRAEEASLFYAASFLREGDWPRCLHEFKRLIREYPASPRVPQAYWHLAMCERNAGKLARPMAELRYTMRLARGDPAMTKLVAADLELLQKRRGGILLDWWRRWCAS